MKYGCVFGNAGSPRSPAAPQKSRDVVNGFSYFKNESAGIKLFAWIILSAEHVIIAGLRTVSHLAILGFSVIAGSNYSEEIQKVIGRLLSH
jgi:hypothetical protein